MNAPKNRLTTPKTTIMKLLIEPDSSILPRNKPNPIPHRPTPVNTNMRILSFFG